MQLDFKELFSSTNEHVSTNPIQSGKLHTAIDVKDFCLIMHSRKSLLLCRLWIWKKKSTESCFDVTTDSSDGAEICEVVGLFIKLSNILGQS